MEVVVEIEVYGLIWVPGRGCGLEKHGSVFTNFSAWPSLVQSPKSGFKIYIPFKIDRVC